MKVTNIALKDFRIYENAEINLDQPLSIIRGANHQGKSSIAQALQLSLSKRADGTDPRGAGANDKIRNGAAKAQIAVRVSGRSGVIDLRTTYGPNKTGRNQTITVPDSDDLKIAKGFESYLDANVDRLACVLDTDFFTSPKTDQRGILATLVLPTSYAFPADKVALAEKHLGKFEWNKPPVAVIDQVYQAAYDERKSAKAALAAIHVPQDPRVPDYSVTTVQEQLQDLRNKAAKEVKKQPSGTVQIGRLEQQVTTLQNDLTTTENNIQSLEASLSEVNSQLLSNDALKKHQRIAAGRVLATELQDKIDATVGEIQAQKDAQAIYLELIEDEDGNPLKEPCCPTCTQAISLEFVHGKIAMHNELESGAVERQLSLMAELKELGDILRSEKAVREHEAILEKKRGIQSNLSGAQTRLAELNVQLQAAELAVADAKAAEPAPVDTTVLDALNAEIATWEERLIPAVNYVSTVKSIETAMESKKAAQAKVSDLETLCTYFGKDGIKATLIGEHVGAFTATVNRVLKVWGYQASLSIDPYEFTVTSKNGALPLKELSGSERLMFGAALQTAIAAHSKIKMVVIDRGDTFINGERGRLFGCLQSLLADGTLDQAIVLLSDDRTEAPKQAGAAFYRVAEGKVVRL